MKLFHKQFLLLFIILGSTLSVYLMPEELDRRFTIYEKRSISGDTPTEEKSDDDDMKTTIGSRVGICYNLLRSFLPKKDNEFTKALFEDHLFKNIEAHDLCKAHF